MYTIKPIISEPTVRSEQTRFRCIYGTEWTDRLAYLADGGGATTDVGKQSNVADNVQLDEMSSLELRQDKVLEQLKELKTKLMSCHAELNICSKPAQPPLKPQQNNVAAAKQSTAAKVQPAVVIKQRPINVDNLQDIVLHANARCPPYSLLAVRALWKNRLVLNIATCTHSSCVQLPGAAAEFNKQIVANANSVEQQLPQLKVLLIWKDTTDTVEMVGSNLFVISGEVNILRYLHRIGPNEFAYDMLSLAESVQTDAILDLCAQLAVHKQNKKEVDTIVKALVKRLEGKQFFGGGGAQPTLSDIAVDSNLKHLPVAQVPKQLTAWQSRVNAILTY